MTLDCQWHRWVSSSTNKHKAVASCEATFCERVVIDGWHWGLTEMPTTKAHTMETLYIYGYSNICSSILTCMPHYE